jgi:hypothetical protein
MAIDASAIQIAVALTAACRTPVANLGIRTRPETLFTSLAQHIWRATRWGRPGFRREAT